MSVASLWVGVEEALDRMAERMDQRIEEWAGIPSIHSPRIKTACRWIAGATIVLLWIVTAEVTVIALRFLVGIF